MSRAERLVCFTQRNKWWVLLAVLASLVVATKGALKVGVDNSLEIWFVEDDPKLETYKDFQEEYGNDEVVILALEPRRPSSLKRTWPNFTISPRR